MIIEDVMRIRKKKTKSVLKGGTEKVYESYFIVFSKKYSDILSKFNELHNVEILTPETKYVIPKAKPYKFSYHYDRKSGKKIPAIAIIIPKRIAEELVGKGIKKIKVIVEVPDLPTAKTQQH
ncbi:MAG: hypothetical protein JHC26_05140 [Thermofilum sp.]|uniref:hypothetical protein n=1 Tax=Thermofilum sp. TaxID=1961369 RepID=UPI00258F2BC7|nr:hypothetical protein [Thermofilum sp.]MCI4408455.1 hypothetical protein [Thermofilum sp.]